MKGYKRIPVYTKTRAAAPAAPAAPAKENTMKLSLKNVLLGSAGVAALAMMSVMFDAGIAARQNRVAPQAPVPSVVAAPVKVDRTHDVFKARPIFGATDSSSTTEPVAKAPVEAPVEHTYTYEEAMAEACEAGRQYKNDVATGFMTLTQAYAEARYYAHDLSAQSAGVDSGVLYAKMKECLW